MGCAPSAVRVRPHNDPRRSTVYNSTRQSTQNSQVYRKDKISAKPIYQSIVNNVKQISNPADMVPQVCVGDTAFPIATAIFRLDEPEATQINLPVVSCALKGNGQIACISSMDYLQPSYFSLYDTPTFFKQLTHVITSSQRTFARTYCVGFNRQDVRNFKPAFEAMGLFLEGPI